jgi:hypothetical protein
LQLPCPGGECIVGSIPRTAAEVDALLQKGAMPEKG